MLLNKQIASGFEKKNDFQERPARNDEIEVSFEGSLSSKMCVLKDIVSRHYITLHYLQPNQLGRFL